MIEGDSDHPLLTLHVPQSRGNVNKGRKSINAICFLPVPTNEVISDSSDDDDDNEWLFVTECTARWRTHQGLVVGQTASARMENPWWEHVVVQIILESAGATNVFADLGVDERKSWSQVTWEEADPDLIVVVEAPWDSIGELIDPDEQFSAKVTNSMAFFRGGEDQQPLQQYRCTRTSSRPEPRLLDSPFFGIDFGSPYWFFGLQLGRGLCCLGARDSSSILAVLPCDPLYRCGSQDTLSSHHTLMTMKT